MRFVQYNGGAGPAYGVQTDEGIYVLGVLPFGEPSYRGLADDEYLEWLSEHVENGTLSTVDPDAVMVLAPVPQPPKIVCDDRDHAEEQDEEIPEEPLLFSKASTAVTNPGSPIVHPDVISTGTPGGVGIFRDPVDLLEPGQTCEAEIDGIGTLTNPVVAE